MKVKMAYMSLIQRIKASLTCHTHIIIGIDLKYLLAPYSSLLSSSMHLLTHMSLTQCLVVGCAVFRVLYADVCDSLLLMIVPSTCAFDGSYIVYDETRLLNGG